jgi:hypothetical protein
MTARKQVSPGLFDHFLVTLDPATGTELKREAKPQPIDQIAYDSQRDLWFLFERNASGIRVEAATLRIGTFDLATGVFVETGSTQVPATETAVIGVLKDRILYRSVTRSTAGSLQSGLTLLNTANPSSVSVMGNPPQSPLPADGAIGSIARPATAAAGGTLTLVQQLGTGCAPDPTWPADAGTAPILCPIKLENAAVGAQATEPNFTTSNVVTGIPQSGARLAWTTSQQNILLVLPPRSTASDPTGHVLPVGALNLTADTARQIPFEVGGPQITSAEYDRCLDLVLATESINARAIFAIPLTAGGTVHKQTLATAAQQIIFEPYTRTVIRSFDDAASPELTAYLLEGTTTAPTLRERLSGSGALSWSPPTDLIPGTILVKSPGHLGCP